MIQGTQYVAYQVCQTYANYDVSPGIHKQIAHKNDLITEVLQHLIHLKSETRKAVKLSEELTALSKPKIQNISVEETLSLTRGVTRGGGVGGWNTPHLPWTRQMLVFPHQRLCKCGSYKSPSDPNVYD